MLEGLQITKSPDFGKYRLYSAGSESHFPKSDNTIIFSKYIFGDIQKSSGFWEILFPTSDVYFESTKNAEEKKKLLQMLIQLSVGDYVKRSELVTTVRLSCSQNGYEGIRALKFVALRTLIFPIPAEAIF